MKRKIITKVIMMFGIVLLLTINSSNIAKADTTTIQYDGKITYGSSTVGSFYVDGKRAFCMDHSKLSPSSGTVAENSIYSDSNVVKCLYYGWEGVEVWSGFNGNSNYGIVATTLALDHYVNGSNKTVAKDFIAFLDSAPIPKESLEFTTKDLEAKIQDGKQVTEQTTVMGTTGITLELNIPNYITIVCDNGNWSKTGGNVELRNGDTIHFEAPINITGNWTSNSMANSYTLNAILSKTNDDKLQRVVKLGKKNPTTYTNISINFVKTGDVKIHKEDRNTKKSLSGAKFNIYRDINENGKIDKGDELVKIVTTGENGNSEESHQEELCYPFAVLIDTGRSSELCGLKWRNIDFKNRKMHIRQSYQRVNEYEYKDGEIIKIGSVLEETTLKSRTSKREIPMSKGVHKILLEIYNETLKKCGQVDDDNFVFINTKGRPVTGECLRNRLDDLLERNNLQSVSLHRFRHTFATRLYEAKVQLKNIQALLGHSTVQMTERYLHINEKDQANAIEQLEQYNEEKGIKVCV